MNITKGSFLRSHWAPCEDLGSFISSLAVLQPVITKQVMIQREFPALMSGKQIEVSNHRSYTSGFLGAAGDQSRIRPALCILNPQSVWRERYFEVLWASQTTQPSLCTPREMHKGGAENNSCLCKHQVERGNHSSANFTGCISPCVWNFPCEGGNKNTTPEN